MELLANNPFHSNCLVDLVRDQKLFPTRGFLAYRTLRHELDEFRFEYWNCRDNLAVKS